MNLKVITVFSLTVSLPLLVVADTIFVLGKPIHLTPSFTLKFGAETSCYEMCITNSSCISFDQEYIPQEEHYLCNIYDTAYQVYRKEGKELTNVIGVQYFSRLYEGITDCYSWFKLGARISNTYDNLQCTFPYRSCQDLYKAGARNNGIYEITLENGNELKVDCVMDEYDGGWTVFQRRPRHDSLDFYQYNWHEYSQGFGTLLSDYWLGLENAHLMTKDKSNKLYVKLVGNTGVVVINIRDGFMIMDSSNNYAIKIGAYVKIAESQKDWNVLGDLNENEFSTRDDDNDDESGKDCAQLRECAWWIKKCNKPIQNSCLNQKNKIVDALRGYDYASSIMMFKQVEA